MKPGEYEYYIDLIVVFILSTLFALMLLIFPREPFFRIILGLPFLLLYPGYALVSVLFPMKHEERETRVKERISSHKLSDRIRKISSLGPSVNKHHNNNPQKEDMKAKGIPGIIRLSLSVALSLAITPTIGVILNILYPLNEEIFGFHLSSILISIYFFICVMIAFAFIRRSRISKKDRFKININSIQIFDETPIDKIITSILIILIVISGGLSFYLYNYYHENEKFTEFYILGENKKMSGYPNFFTTNETRNIFVGIRNNEYEDAGYHISISLDGSRKNETTIQELDYVELVSNTRYIFELNLSHNEEFIERIDFQVPIPGDHLLELDLFKDDELYRELSLSMMVFNDEDITYSHDDSIIYYLTGPDQDPSGFDTKLQEFQPLDLEMGILNEHNQTLRYNLTIRTSRPSKWIYINQSQTISINEDQGGYHISITPPERYSIIRIRVLLPKGQHTLYIGPSNLDPDRTFEKRITVVGV